MLKVLCISGLAILLSACSVDNYSQKSFGSNTHHHSGIADDKPINIKGSGIINKEAEKTLGSTTHHHGGQDEVASLYIIGDTLPVPKEQTFGSNTHHHKD